MNFDETKSKIKKSIKNLKDVKIDNQKKQAELEEQRSELMSDVSEIEGELKRLQKKKHSAEEKITEAGKEAIEELSEAIAITERKISNLGGLLERKAEELQELNRQSDRLFLEVTYPKHVKALKAKRDEAFKTMLDHIDLLREDYEELTACRSTHKKLARQATSASNGERITTGGSWGLTIRGLSGKTISRGWENSFEAWIKRLAELEDKLVV